ncbi:retrovirus-related pol polyprotein from transposon TNT 1-94 [Tanacetum coccineum]
METYSPPPSSTFSIVTSLKKDFKQKENKYQEEFLDMKALKEKVEDKLFKQDQSLQTVHMLCKPKPYYDEQRKVAIGYKNPLCLTRAKQVQPALYNGHEIIKTHHVPAIVHNSEDTLEIAEITRKKMNDKMKTPLWTEQNINIRPPDYSKENYLATFTPQTQLTPEQIFWSKDVLKMKTKALKEQTKASRPIKALTVYPPNTPATLVPRVLPTKQHFKGIQKALTKEIKEMKEIFKELKAEVDQNVVNRGLNSCTDASGSKPRSNTKKNRISPAKSVNKKKVEEHPRTNKSSLKNMNRVDSSISSKRTVINSNSHSVCKTCNKCLISANHDMCVVNYLHSVNASPSVKNVVRKVKKVWKPKQVWKTRGKVLTNVGYQWKPTGRIFTLGEQCPLTRLTTSNVLPVQQTKNVSTSKTVITEKLSNTSQKPLTSYQRRNKQYKAIPTSIPTPTVNQAIDTSMQTDVAYANQQDPNKIRIQLSKISCFQMQVVQIVLWYLDSGCSKHMTEDRSRLRNFVKKFIGTVRFGNDHFGAIMGYGDYVIGDKAVATACYTQNRSLIHTRHDKTPYELVHDKKSDLTFFRVFGALCYPTNDSEDFGKLQPTADIRIFVGYAPSRKGYRIYNKRTRRIMETIHVQFDELTKQMATVQLSTGPAPSFLTPGLISSGLVPNPVPAAPYVPPIN